MLRGGSEPDYWQSNATDNQKSNWMISDSTFCQFLPFVRQKQVSAGKKPTRLYADYAVLFSRDLNVLQLNLDQICTWCDDNLLKLNVKKSKCMMMMIGQYRHSMADEVIIYLKDTRMERERLLIIWD